MAFGNANFYYTFKEFHLFSRSINVGRVGSMLADFVAVLHAQ
jgi:hypothetical protein